MHPSLFPFPSQNVMAWILLRSWMTWHLNDSTIATSLSTVDSFLEVQDTSSEQSPNVQGYAIKICTTCTSFKLHHLFSLTPTFFSLSRLEILSTIIEIRGPLRIQGWPEQTFPYLRNLRRVGHPNGTTLNLFCNDGRRCKFSPACPTS